MSLEQQNEPFNMRDLSLDVRLEAIVDGVTRDFTGKKIFAVNFFRKGISFGITDIDIEVNTSLQPIITITFKDLYGNTLFGKTKNETVEDEAEEETDFSVLFNWPPPKYLFTFKGFLGKSATWMLNMKKSSVSYDSSDGSYSVKCEFVPNQWGFLSDLPFLYLLAVKSLKKKTLLESEFAKVQTIFDLIKIGKQVEVKTKETTKEFDNILKQMTLLKSQRVYDALIISKVINYNEAITGQVGNQTISPFNVVTINEPKGDGNTSIDTQEKLKSLATSAENLRRINAFLLLTAKIGNLEPEQIKFSQLATGDIRTSVPNFDEKIASRQKVLSDNIEIIENAIKKKTYDSSKDQLEKVTIGEIFRQLSEDAGYIMGRILEAGTLGYQNNSGIRDGLVRSGKLIGKHFPLTIDDKKEEKPASRSAGVDVGIETYELQFVSDFIDSISEGIATELAEENSAAENVGSNLIKKRICNLEALRENPYKPFFQSIAENILIRGGIVGYLVRSPDPNRPGDYDKTFFATDRATNAEDVIALADADLENITDSIISGLSDGDFKKLKRFCIFWDNLLTEDCENLRVANDEGSLIEGNDIDNYLSSLGSPLSSDLLDYEVVLEKPAQWKPTFISSGNKVQYSPIDGLEVTTLRKVISDVFRPRNASGGGVDATNSRFIDVNTLQAVKVVNNGLTYFNPKTSVSDDEHVFVMFDGPDATKTQEVMSAESDGEIKSEAEAQRDEADFLGFVNIQNPYQKDGTTFVDSITRMNSEAIPDRLLLNYPRLLNPSNAFFQNNINVDDTESYCFVGWPPGATQAVTFGNPDNLGINNISPKGITLAVVFHPAKTELVFGPFVSGSIFGTQKDSSTVHRGYIKRMCAKLKEKMDAIEQKKNQVISDVLGKSGEQKDLLYKQMHVLFQQWEVLIIKDSDSANGQNPKGTSPGEITTEMADRYKGDEKHKNVDIASNVAEEAADNTFLYGYPLNASKGATQINVKNSIINIDPLYKPNGNTTVLNIIQQICTKNNFIFIPMPGDPGAFSTSEIFSPHLVDKPRVKNFFYVQFAPTPESRATLSNSDNTPITSIGSIRDNLPDGTLLVKFGSPDNQIVKNITVDTQESKATAESIVNLQRLVDNENQNKKVTTDCSMLPVMEGRSYKATAEMLGNAQVFPMQFFYLDSIPLFNGLYQIMKVKHSIKPNDMTTSAEGIRMRVDIQNGNFGGIPPVTLETLASLPVTLSSGAPPEFSPEDFLNQVQDQGVGVQDGTSGSQVVGSKNAVAPPTSSKGGSDIKPSSTVTTAGVILPPDLRAVKNSIRLTQSSDGNNAIPIGDTDSTYTKEVIIRNLNQFIEDVLGPFATFLKTNYPHLYKNWYITSAQRNYVPAGGSKISQHQKGQAIDSQIMIGAKGSLEWQRANLEFLNAILKWYEQNPVGYDQILWETRKPGSNWIHWSYVRNNNRLMLLRFVDDKTNRSAKVNTTGKYVLAGVTEAQLILGV